MVQAVPFEVPRLRALARHSLPHLIEATFAPLALFYLCLWAIGVWGALGVALAWSYGALLRRLVTRQRVPGILVLGVLALTVRTAIAMASGSVFVYFLQPTIGTVAVALLFLASVRAGRPLAERLAADFCPLPTAFSSQPRVRRLFSNISLLWAFINLANAAVTIWLLVSQPLPVFLLARTLVSLTFTGAAIAVSTLYFKRSMRRHGMLVTA